MLTGSVLCKQSRLGWGQGYGLAGSLRWTLRPHPHSWNLASTVENRVGDPRDSIYVWTPRIKLYYVLVVTQGYNMGVRNTIEPEFLSEGFWLLPAPHRRFSGNREGTLSEIH